MKQDKRQAISTLADIISILDVLQGGFGIDDEKAKQVFLKEYYRLMQSFVDGEYD